MSEETRLWIMIATVAVTNLVTFGVTFMYWQDKFYGLLREQAAESKGRDVELSNARIISQTFGDMRAQSIAGMMEDTDDA